MAETAERVLVQIEANTTGFETNVARAARVHGEAMSSVTGAATRAEVAIRTSSEGAARAVESGTARARAGYVQLGQQVQDIGAQLSGGTGLATIFAQQSGQVINAIQLMRGEAGGFLGFLGGPWGAAIVAGASVLGVLVSKLVEGGDTVESETQKLEDNARKAKLSAEAHQAYAETLEGSQAAIRATARALDDLSEGHKSAARTALEHAAAERINAQAALDTARASVAAARSELEANAANVQSDDPQVAAQAATDLAASQRRLDAQAANLATLQANLNNASSNVARAAGLYAAEEVQARLRETATPEGRITADYEARIARERELLIARHASNDEIARSIGLLELQKQRDIEASREGTRAANRAASEARSAARRAQRDSQREARDLASGNTVPLAPIVANMRVLSPFGVPRPNGHYADGRPMPFHTHAGVDIQAPYGSPVYAPQAGFARRRSNPNGLGNYAEIDAGGGVRIRLAHLSGFTIPEGGAAVRAGEQVGLVGTSGNARGGTPHVHYERREGGRNVNPLAAHGRAGDPEQAQQQALDRQAQEEARQTEAWNRNQAAMLGELQQSSQRLVQARMQGAITAEQRTDLEARQIVTEQAQAKRQAFETARRRAVEDPVHAAAYNLQRDMLVTQARELASERLRQLYAAQAVQAEKDRLSGVENAAQGQRETLQLQQSLAVTDRERRDIALRMVDVAEQLQREQLQSLIRQKELAGIDDQELRNARADLARLPEQSALRRRAAAQQYATPHERYMQGLNNGLDDVDTRLQQLDVDAMNALENAIVNAAKSALGLKGALGDIVGELVRIGIQRQLIQPLANRLFGPEGNSGGGIFGFLSGLLGGRQSFTAAQLGFTQALPSNLPTWGGGIPIPGFATGGSFEIGGTHGVDRNTLSLNGSPLAKVSRGERLQIVPQGKAPANVSGIGAARPITYAPTYQVNVSADQSVTPAGFAKSLARDILQEAARMDAQASSAVLKAVPNRLSQYQSDGL